MAAPQRRQQQQQQQPQQQQQQQQQQPRQQVTINAALDTLCNMFESVDRDVVHMILIEGCGGNMESAVEALLTMTGGISQKQKQQKQPQSQSQSPKRQQQQQQQQSSQLQSQQSKPQQSQQSQQQQQGSLINLPDDFLRPPSYFLSKYENSHEYNFENASKRQIIEDEMFAKAIFEDSLFSADLHANPEWVLEELNNDKQKQQHQGNNNNNKKKKNKKKYSWRGQYNSQFEDEDNEHRQIDLDNVDPSDLNARKISFKQRFNSLGVSAKQKLGNLAHKLQRNKQEAKQNKFESKHQYKNILTSLDDETLIDDDDDNLNNAIIEVASEDNRGTYQAPIVPNKPSQKL